MEFLLIPKDTPLMTGEVSTWDFFKSDSLRKPKNLETEKN